MDVTTVDNTGIPKVSVQEHRPSESGRHEAKSCDENLCPCPHGFSQAMRREGEV
jgi:hypothetical protein